MKLLLVDDDAFLRDMYAIKFGESDFEVDVAETAEQALTKIEQARDYDVILMDMIMPGLGGVELIGEVHRLFPEMNPCMIVLSNQGQESDIAEAKRAGAAGYIVKAEAIPSDVVAKVSDIIKTYKSK